MQILKLKTKEDINLLREQSDTFSSGTVTALGFFDGVHLAHRMLLAKAKDKSDELGLPFVIFTFSSDSELLKTNTKKLFTDEERLFIFETCGTDAVIMADFALFRDLSKEEFVHGFLIEALGAQVAVCGFNFRFAKSASGNSTDLKLLMEQKCRTAEICEEYLYESKTLSSTYIRELLSEKKLKEAAKLLGKPYFISGKVSHGLGLGTKLGIPTVNTELAKGRFVLPFGVYLSATVIEDKTYISLTNIGSCPTFEEREAHAETFILNFSGDIYDCNVRIYFIEFIRDEKKFSSAEELIMQINVDKNKALEISGDVKWQELGLN